jgi:Secretion system C-terminal sorting domain/Fibronectin type III domain
MNYNCIFVTYFENQSMKKSYALPIFLFFLFISNFGHSQSENSQKTIDNSTENPRSVLGDVWAFDMLSDNYGKFPLAGPYNFEIITTIPYIITASDFDDNMNIYGVDFLTNELILVEPATGSYSVIATLSPVPSGHVIDGMSWNYVDSTMYVISGDGTETSLHTLNLSTGVLSTIGTTIAALGVWIVIDNNGIAYMADTFTDELFTINLTNAQATLIGPLGINIEYSQEADIDPETNILYMGAYFGGGDQSIYSVDTTTGTASFISAISGANELGIFAIEGTPVPIENFVCEDALPVVIGILSSNNPANTQGGASNVCFTGATNSEWYSFTANENGELTISSDLPENTGIDTRLSIYNDNCLNLSCIAFDDNSGTGNTSVVTFIVTQGSTYLIEWDDAFNTSPFTFEISFQIDCPVPQNFSATNITDTSADLSWTGVTNATMGYEISVFNEGDDPLSDPPVYTNNVASGVTMDTVSGLNPNMAYDAYILSDCAGGIFSDSTMITFNTIILSIEQFENGPIILFPNPTLDGVTIISEKNIQNITVNDINGRSLQHQNTTCNECYLDLSKLTSGIYFIVLNSEYDSIISRIVKQ